MFSIHIKRQIDKPIEQVFEYLSDHANYSQFRGIDDSRLLSEGNLDKNGMGAIREVVSAGGTLHEEIVGFTAPTYFAYKIIFSKPLNYDHELGELKLTPVDANKTLVEWTSKGRIRFPILGPLYFDKQIQKNGSRAFGSILKQIHLMD